MIVVTTGHHFRSEHYDVSMFLAPLPDFPLPRFSLPAVQKSGEPGIFSLVSIE